MPDPGARYTDKQIAELEARLTAMYETAYKDVREKYMAFVQRFLTKDKEYRQKLKDGEITKEEYDAWLRGQVFQKTRWEAQLDDLAQTLTHTTQTAMDIINDAAPGVFAMNANYAEYEIERAGNIDMGFGLYDEDTVRRLVRDDPNLLPPSKVNIPLEQQWNRTLINRQIGVGIIAGEGIMAIADRLQRSATMSRNQALTHARTAMTGAQNAGRIEGYHRAEKKGIKLEKEWLATLDGHTRRAHAALDGQHVPVDKPFKSLLGNIMYPGDPSAHPSNVYNCRCTLISHLLDYPSQNAKRRPNEQKLGDKEVQKPIKDMTYAQWAKWKKDRLKTDQDRDTITASEEDGGVVLRPAGTIVRGMYEKITTSITTDEVIITDERIAHSNLHDNAYDKYKQYMPEVLSDPDIVFRDKKPNTAILIKRIVQEGNNLQLVLRLHVPEDDPEYKNSVISFWDISDKRRENYERNKDIVYKRK